MLSVILALRSAKKHRLDEKHPRYDIIRRDGELPIICHYGIIVSEPGEELRIFHVTNGEVPKIVDFRTFAKGHKIIETIHCRTSTDTVIRHRIIEMLKSKRPYDPINFNCEHLVNYVLFGIPTSPQKICFVLTIGAIFAAPHIMRFLFS